MSEERTNTNTLPRRVTPEQIRRMREARKRLLNKKQNIAVGDFIQEAVSPALIAERVALYDKAGYDLLEIVSTPGRPILLFEKRGREVPKGDPKVLKEIIGADTIVKEIDAKGSITSKTSAPKSSSPKRK